MEDVVIVPKAKPFGISKLEKRINDTTQLMPKWDDAIVKILEDQHPHSIAEIASRVNLSAEKIEYVFQFLAKYSLITYDDESQTAVICTDFSLLTSD